MKGNWDTGIDTLGNIAPFGSTRQDAGRPRLAAASSLAGEGAPQCATTRARRFRRRSPSRPAKLELTTGGRARLWLESFAGDDAAAPGTAGSSPQRSSFLAASET